MPIFISDSTKSLCLQRRQTDRPVGHSPKFSFLMSVVSLFQSKDIGIQMHEELVKVTNELYTVSNSPRIDPPHLISSLRSSRHFSSIWPDDILFHVPHFFILFYCLSSSFVHREVLTVSSGKSYQPLKKCLKKN